jgi:catechol 2,3-dioxygenase-like lactoylglutathione lyase family enzyme
MKFRHARHTTDLNVIQTFYQDILGLELLSSFNNHNGYDGIFLGKQNADWHLEFTTSDEEPHHTTDEDDCLVFYVSANEQEIIRQRCHETNVSILKAKNPYWNLNGLVIRDPDDYTVIVAIG